VRSGKVPLILNLSTRWRWVAKFYAPAASNPEKEPCIL